MKISIIILTVITFLGINLFAKTLKRSIHIKSNGVRMLILLFLSFGILQAQECRYRTQGKLYNAFCAKHLNGTGLGVSIARNGNAGFLVLQKECPTSDKFVGNAYLFLENEHMITLLDRGMFWKVNDICYAEYKLTPSEINLLKNNNILEVRYFFCPNIYACDGVQSELNGPFATYDYVDGFEEDGKQTMYALHITFDYKVRKLFK